MSLRTKGNGLLIYNSILESKRFIKGIWNSLMVITGKMIKYQQDITLVRN